MSEKKDTTHTLLPRKLVLFLRPRSKVWQCRFKIEGRWQRTSTSTYELEEAREKALEIFQEANFRKRMNYAPITRSFKHVAEYTIKKLEESRGTPDFKPIYTEYRVLIEKYLIPFFGKYKIDSIDFQLIESFKEWRVNKMGQAPSRSTELNHNAALNRIFDYAEANGFLHAVNRSF